MIDHPLWMLSGAMLLLIGLSQVSKPLSQALAIVTKTVSGVRLQVFDSAFDMIPSYAKISCLRTGSDVQQTSGFRPKYWQCSSTPLLSLE